MFILLNSGGFPFYLVPQVSALHGACDHKASTQPCYHGYMRASRALLNERSGHQWTAEPPSVYIPNTGADVAPERVGAAVTG